MYLIKAVHNPRNSDSKNCLPKCAELHDPPTSPIRANTRKKKKERDARPSDSHPRQQILLRNLLHWNVCLRLVIRISVHHGRNRYWARSRACLEVEKGGGDPCPGLGQPTTISSQRKKSKTKKKRHTPQAKSTFHPYPSPSPSPRF